MIDNKNVGGSHSGVTTSQEEDLKQSLDSILGKHSKGPSREVGLRRLAKKLQDIDSRLDFKQSARGWCYTLENENVIDKGEFDRAENAINDCRKLGLLPIDFCAEDVSRSWGGVEEPTQVNIDTLFRVYLKAAINAPNYFTADWWEGEKYYIQMMVEKVDLKSLFNPICQKYHIPITNSKGWSDLNERAEMAYRFKGAEDKGQQCVLLVCGDFDPWGLKITDTIEDNLRELAQATDYYPTDLIIDRFGLNYDFIEENNLSWIDNLKTSSKKDLTKSNYCYNCEIQHSRHELKCRQCNRGMYAQPDFVLEYVERYGARKCEANALVVAPEEGRALAEKAIQKYLGLNSLSRFNTKRMKVLTDFVEFKQKHKALFKELDKQLEILHVEEDEQGIEEADEEGND